MTPELQQFQAEAFTELKRIKSITDEIIKKLESTVPLAVAYEIVDNLWLTNQASRLKTELSSEFPERNGSVILNAPLTEEVSLLLAIPKTVEFLDKAFPEIIIRVKEVYSGINSKGLSDETAIELYNNFRKEPARFADFVKDLWYPESDRLQKGLVGNWKEISQSSYSVENGDYLLMTDYAENIRKAQGALYTTLVDSMLKDGITLRNISYKIDQLVGMVNLIGLFGAYIETLDVS